MYKLILWYLNERVARLSCMHSKVNSVYVSRFKVFSKLCNLRKFRSWSRRGLSVVMATKSVGVGSKRMQKQSWEETRGWGREEVELGKDAFILPTGNYPNNTCISSTPVAHRLSSEGTEDGECRGSERGRRDEGDGQRGERNIINCGHERRNNGIIVESADYVIHRRRSEKPFLYLFRYRVLLVVSQYAFSQSPSFFSHLLVARIFNSNDIRVAWCSCNVLACPVMKLHL